MSKVIVLGGSGAVGSVVVRALSGRAECSEVVAADIDLGRAEKIAAEAGGKVVPARVDASDPADIKRLVKDCDLVVSCVGPFYKFAPIILPAVIEAGKNYLDICDDVDVTDDILALDGKAREAGVTAVIGMGSSPGATNLLAKFAASTLLDECDSIDIFHAHGGEPFEGEGVIGHRFHCMTIDVPMYLEGELKYVKFFEPEGIALREKFEFPVIGETTLYPYPHPEQVTLPRYIECRRVTNKGTVLPEEYYNLTKDLARLGFADKEPMDVKGVSVSPYDFAVSYIIRERERILRETNFGSQRGCASVVVKGKKDGAASEYRFHMASRTQALGEGTGIPAAVGALLVLAGKVKGPGVYPPEACIEPADFIELVPGMMKLDSKKEGGDSFGGVIVEHIDASGKVTKLDI